MPYIYDTPYMSGSTTSHDAAVSVSGKTAAMRGKIYSYITKHRGATCWEVEEGLGLRHQTASARIRELFLSGHIVDSGKVRPTGSGRNAVVWRKVPA